jgi:hypothetical protein
MHWPQSRDKYVATQPTRRLVCVAVWILRSHIRRSKTSDDTCSYTKSILADHFWSLAVGTGIIATSSTSAQQRLPQRCVAHTSITSVTRISSSSCNSGFDRFVPFLFQNDMLRQQNSTRVWQSLSSHLLLPSRRSLHSSLHIQQRL